MGDTVLGTPAPPALDRAGRVTFAQLRAAAPFDPMVFRAFRKVMGMMCRPEKVYADPAVVARTRGVLSDQGSAPPMAQPSREQLGVALAV